MTTHCAGVPYAWLNHDILSDAKVVDLGFGSRLFKIASGAILSWRFDEDGEFDHILLVHLTDGEAQSVIDARGAGMLESVRSDIRDGAAMLVVSGNVDFAVRHTSISRHADESEFTDALCSIAAQMQSRIESFQFKRDWAGSHAGDEMSVMRQAIDFHNAVHCD